MNTTAQQTSTLQDITRRETGVFLYPHGAAFVCNWSGISGLPFIGPIDARILSIGELTSVSEVDIDDLNGGFVERAQAAANEVDGKEAMIDKVFQVNGIAFAFTFQDWI